MGAMMNLERSVFKKSVSFIKSPVTEMIFAAIIDLSRNYLFAFIHQFIGDQLIYTIIQYLILIIPWIMLGHGALRFPQKTNKENSYFGHQDYSKSLKQNNNFLIMSLLFSASLIIKFLSI